ncbi:MAG: hypothetical protein A2Y25_10815 [Candidatus Melainabacteria bacterium GWF2_37_15]|nr:MAG: hypothetical protein A2Y25_10815 [Candidatus Melainabacteria bacterium GWF2_37_15]
MSEAIAPVISKPVATAGLVYDLKNVNLGPLVQNSGQNNPAAMTMEEALGEKPKRSYTALKIATGLAAAVGIVYGLARAGAGMKMFKTAESGVKKTIKEFSEKTLEKYRAVGNWFNKTILRRGAKETDLSTPPALPAAAKATEATT